MGDEKLKTIIGGNVDDAKSKLDGLTLDELNQLHALEEQGQKRTTMLTLIDRERKTRSEGGNGESNGGGTDGEATDKDGPALFTQADVDAKVAAARADMFTGEQVDAIVAERKLAFEAEADRRVAAATGSVAPTVTIEAREPLVIDPADSHLLTDALIRGAEIVFVGDDDVPIAGLPPMAFDRSAFDPAGAGVTLLRDIAFPKELPLADVAGAFLMDDEGDPVAVARLVMPFAIGGGRDAKLAPGTLRFD